MYSHYVIEFDHRIMKYMNDSREKTNEVMHIQKYMFKCMWMCPKKRKEAGEGSEGA